MRRSPTLLVRHVPPLMLLALACGGPAADSAPDSAPASGEAATSDSAVAATGPAATDIFLLPLAGEGETLVIEGEVKQVIDREGYDNQPAFTPEGDALLYTSIIGDGQAESYGYEIESSLTRRLTETPESEYSPTPIPGSDRFSVVRVEADSAQRLWSFAADGSDPRLLLESVAPVGYHTWVSPRQVALFVLGDPPTLRLADVRSGRAAVMAERIGRSLQKVPGRETVTFTQEADGEWWIRELDPATGTITPVAPLLGPDEYHAWTPGGTLLTASGTALYRWSPARGGAEVEGNWVELVDLGPHGLGRLTRLAVSPDGTRLAVVVDR